MTNFTEIRNYNVKSLTQSHLIWPNQELHSSTYFQDAFFGNKNPEECKTRTTLQDNLSKFLAYI